MKRAAIAIIQKDGKWLTVSRRNDLTDMGFPGGKVEDEETTEEGLLREVEEEVGLRILAFRLLLCRISHDHIVHVFEILDWEGQPTSLEGTEVRWLTDVELFAQKTFGAFNRMAVRQLKRTTNRPNRRTNR